MGERVQGVPLSRGQPPEPLLPLPAAPTSVPRDCLSTAAVADALRTAGKGSAADLSKVTAQHVGRRPARSAPTAASTRPHICRLASAPSPAAAVGVWVVWWCRGAWLWGCSMSSATMRLRVLAAVFLPVAPHSSTVPVVGVVVLGVEVAGAGATRLPTSCGSLLGSEPGTPQRLSVAHQAALVHRWCYASMAPIPELSGGWGCIRRCAQQPQPPTRPHGPIACLS